MAESWLQNFSPPIFRQTHSQQRDTAFVRVSSRDHAFNLNVSGLLKAGLDQDNMTSTTIRIVDYKQIGNSTKFSHVGCQQFVVILQSGCCDPIVMWNDRSSISSQASYYSGMNVCNLGIDRQYYDVREYRQDKQTSPSPPLLSIGAVNANLEFRFRGHADVWFAERTPTGEVNNAAFSLPANEDSGVNQQMEGGGSRIGRHIRAGECPWLCGTSIHLLRYSKFPTHVANGIPDQRQGQ